MEGVRSSQQRHTCTRTHTHAHTHQAPAHAHTPITARKSRQEGIPPPPTTLTQEEETLMPQLREKALAILRMDNIQLWDPEYPLLSQEYTPLHLPHLPRTAFERLHCSLAVGAATSQPLPSSPTVAEPIHISPLPPPGTLPPPARVPGPLARISIDPEKMDETLRQPFFQELVPFAGRRLGDYELVALEEMLLCWSTAIKEVVTAHRRRPPNPTSHWARCRRRRKQEVRSPSPDTELPADPSQTTEQGQTSTNNRASGRARQAAKARYLQRFYRANPGVCMRRLLDNSPPVYCNIAEQELVTHFTATFTEPPPLDPPPSWLFPDRHPGDTGASGVTDEGDVLRSPITPEEVVAQFRRTKRTSPGADGITYANWRWVILSTIFNICRINTRVPRPWKHSTVTLIHKGDDVTSIRNWRPISLQLTLYKLYSAIIA